MADNPTVAKVDVWVVKEGSFLVVRVPESLTSRLKKGVYSFVATGARPSVTIEEVGVWMLHQLCVDVEVKRLNHFLHVRMMLLTLVCNRSVLCGTP